jgi:hypothetical protein
MVDKILLSRKEVPKPLNAKGHLDKGAHLERKFD